MADAMRLPVPPGHSLAELATEAIAALALPGHRSRAHVAGRTDTGNSSGCTRSQFEVLRSPVGRWPVTVVRVGDNQEVARSRLRIPSQPRTSVERLASARMAAICAFGTLICGSFPSGGIGQSEWSYQFNDAGYVDAVCFAPDNTRLIYVASPDSRISVVDLATGQARYLPRIDMQRPVIHADPDSRRIAIAGCARRNEA